MERGKECEFCIPVRRTVVTCMQALSSGGDAGHALAGVLAVVA